MIKNARVFAMIVACSTTVATVPIILFFCPLSWLTTLFVFGIIFIVPFLVSYGLLEWQIFRALREVHELVTKFRKGGNKKGRRNRHSSDPFMQLKREITQFSEEKNKEIEELKKLEAFRKEFIADISHELKTPIFAAQGFVHTLIDGAVNDKSVRSKFLKKAAKSLDGLDALVQDLLTLSHIETGQIKMHFENFDLYKLTEEVFEQFESRADRKDIDLSILGPERKVIVYADWQRIHQVMTNLVSNAIKHSYEDGDVSVVFDIGRKEVDVRVKDQGEGIPNQHIGRIFERFYRVDKSRSREKGGTGLGLAIVKHILEGHGSRPEVFSEEGKGSVFSFKLPVGKEGQEVVEMSKNDVDEY